MGDNRDGDTVGDDENVKITLDNLPSDVYQLWCTVNVYNKDK